MYLVKQNSHTPGSGWNFPWNRNPGVWELYAIKLIPMPVVSGQCFPGFIMSRISVDERLKLSVRLVDIYNGEPHLMNKEAIQERNEYDVRQGIPSQY